MSKRKKIRWGLGTAAVLFLASIIFWSCWNGQSEEILQQPGFPMPEIVRGVHLTAWVVSSKKRQEDFKKLLADTELNSVAIAIKEFNGEVYIPGVEHHLGFQSYVPTVRDWPGYLAELKAQGVYTIARMVVFKDDRLARARPDLAVKRRDGSLWTNDNGKAWADPYQKDVWEYNLAIASAAVTLGFDEIQFDYIRFPSDGRVKECQYSYQNHTSTSALQCLQDFLEEAEDRLKSRGAKISICVFGLTTSAPDDLGIGQRILDLSQWVDAVCPMVYPSHYNKGEYRIPDPDAEPHKTVSKAMSYAIKRMGAEAVKLRPYLQGFTLESHYGPHEIKEQIRAVEEQEIKSWFLWNAKCHYHRRNFRTDEEAAVPRTP